jgi:hypothetical protein
MALPLMTSEAPSLLLLRPPPNLDEFPPMVEWLTAIGPSLTNPPPVWSAVLDSSWLTLMVICPKL